MKVVEIYAPKPEYCFRIETSEDRFDPYTPYEPYKSYKTLEAAKADIRKVREKYPDLTIRIVELEGIE